MSSIVETNIGHQGQQALFERCFDDGDGEDDISCRTDQVTVKASNVSSGIASSPTIMNNDLYNADAGAGEDEDLLAPIANSAARNAFLNLLDYIRVNVAPDERATRVRLAYRMVGVLEVNIPEAAILLHFPLYVPRGVEGGDSLSDLSGSCTGILQGGQQPGGVVAVLHHDNIQGGDPQAVPMHENHLVVFDNEVDEARVADNENGGSNGGSRVSGDTSIEPNHQACDQEQ